MLVNVEASTRQVFKTGPKDPYGKVITALLGGSPAYIGDQAAKPDYMQARGYRGVVDQHDFVDQGLFDIYVMVAS